ncbi:hemagglutinin repeat-containing protein [Haemophilus sp. oral taxon 851]|uniref:two-partner secretion domain-containing protein n=1 Tax=Haemophilus sp. oral taxon 851 TaxID=762964 RepID=UPI0002462146|nr:hemagglutinin repeat-containing protein [Haemophilus sp. oral taxon 851]EHO48139.1 filamentous hemagglutinin family domain protein [Haemophilus sp. oral taxon 851 str. F0397]
MNKRHYKVIFSRVLNQLVVVSELAKSQGKAQSENVSPEQEKTGLFSTALSLNPIHFSLMLALGFVFLSPSIHAEDMAIRADKSAPGNQQPTVLQTANGLPQVNIQTPSAGGVSRNQYSQFDVAEKGAVLNNARKAAQTQMAGWVQGNPNLARGEAKVILNEVNSANPSRLKGYVEVAGKKADVVIANPSGIQCDGCGVINAGRTTLTTGKAEVENGELKSYRVKGGKVTVGQKGMDNSQSDYTDIIAEKAEIKGGVWSKKGIKVTTGKNNVDRTNDSVVYVGDKNTDNTDRTFDTQGDNQSYSVDVSQLGGMYAEKIHLVDNGQGLGVRNAGHIGASAGSVKIDSQGKIVNEGFIGGSENAQLNAKKNIENRGTVYAKAQTQLNGQNIDNKQGVIAGKQVQINTNNVDNRKQSDKGSLIVASEKVLIKAKNLDNSGTKSNGQNEQGIKATALELQADNVTNQQGGIYVSQKADISLKDKLVNLQGEILSDGEFHIKGDKNTASIDNNEGRVHAGEKLSITAKKLENEGQISSTGDADIALKDSFTLNKAFQVDGHLQFSTDGKFTNKTQLRTGQGVMVKAAEIDNLDGSEIASQVTHIVTSQLTNRGLIDGIKNRIDAESLNNLGTGRLYGNHLSIASKNLTNDKEGDASATIAARERLDLGVEKMKNLDHGLVLSLGDLAIGGQLDEQGKAVGKAGEVFNGSATIEALGDGKINTAKLLNTDLHLTLGVDTSYEGFTEYALHKDSTRYRTGPKGVGEIDWNRKSRNAWFNFNDGRPRLNQDDWHKWEYTRTTKTDRIDSQDPGKILIGGNLSLSGDDLKNQYSKLLVGKTLYLGDSAVSANPNHKDLVAGATKLINEDKIGEIHRVDDGKYGQLLSYRDKNPVRRRYGHKTEWKDNYHREHATEYFNFNVVKNNIGDLAAVKEASSQSTIGARNEAEAVGAVNNAVRLPNASLYKINQDPQSHYVVETDPQFADKRTWLSSDYMFNALRNDAQNLLKRLGDGYYEQRLINEQINQLTGKRFLDGYDNDYAQYKTLMDNGVLYAKKWQLVPGVALTEAQMKELTSDLVWFEKQETVLPNGQKVSVLAPKVYLAPRNVKVNGEGAIISANKVVINGIQQVENSGTILGNKGVSINADNITNDKGRVQGDAVLLVAENTLKNIGGVIEGKDVILAQAKKVQIEGSVSETQDDGKFHQKTIGKVAEINLTNKEGEVQIYTDEDITVKGAKANIAGDAVFNAKSKLELGVLDTHNKEHYGSGDNYYRLEQDMQVGNRLNVGGDVKYIGGEKVSIIGNDLHVDGNALIASKGDIEIKEGRNKELLSSGVKTVDKGLSKVTRVIKHEHDYDLAQGSTLDANKIRIQSDSNVTVQGSNVVAENGLTVAGKNIDIKEAENRVYSEDFSMTKKSGLLGGGIGFTIGKQKQTLENDQTRLYASGSQVGSLNNNTTMVAENAYTQTASIVSAIKGDVNILAKKVDIKAAEDKYETNTKQTFEQKGLTIAITSPVISAIQAAQGVVQSTRQVGESKHDRVNAMAAANAGFDAYRTYQSGTKAVTDVKDFMNGEGDVDSLIGVQITYGQQKNESRTHTEGKTAAKSQVNAGGKVNIVATGAGKDSNINIEGSDISGKQGTTLIADNQVDIKATEQNHQERSTNKSSGFNAGVAIKVSNGAVAGATLGGNYGKGYGNGDETTYVASHVGDSQSKTVIQASGDANIIGSQVKGKRVELNAENLNIESLQDKSRYHGKQMNVNGSVTVGYGASVGGSFNKSKINADHASVNEQAGIYAGDEGYDINVNKHTDLKGALITSTQKAEADGKNHFNTASTTHSDIENHSNYSGSSFGVSGSVSANFETPFGKDGQAQSGVQAKNAEGQPLYRDANGKETTVKTDNPILAAGWDSVETTHSVGFGYDKDSQSSTTKSGINTKNIEIRDTSTQESLTGKTVNETISAIKTDITLDSAQSQSGKLENRFNKDDVQKELDIQRSVTEKFDQTRQGIKDELLKIADAKRAEAVEIRRNNRGEDGKTGYNTDESLKLEEQADTWERASLVTDLVLGGVYGWGNSTALKYTSSAAVGTPMTRTAFSPEQIWLEKCKQDSLYCADHNMDGALRPKENDKKAQIGYKRQIFDISELKPSDLNNVITISNNGIFNPFDDALKNAIKQNKWDTNKEGVVVVYNRPTGNIISEMLYAAYDKTNDLLGGRLPLTTAEKANVKLYDYAKQNGYQIDLSNHSRGGLTASVALQYANRNGLTNIPIRESRFFGTATNVQSYKNNLVENNGGYIYKDKNGNWQSSDGAEVKSAVHKADFVGNKWNLGLTGFNDTTGGSCLWCYSHSSYYAEIPSDHLINENGDFIDNKGNIVETKVLNKYSDDFIKIWDPKDKNANPSLPKIIKYSGDK